VSIRARLLLLILFATLIPALLGGMLFLERRDSEIADAQRDVAATARRVAQDLSDTVRGTAQLLYGLSRARDLDTQDRAACSDFLARVLKEYPQYTGILTITPKGDLFCDSLRTGRELHLTDRRYFQRALTSKNPLAVEPAFGRLTGIAVLQIAYAARRETGEPRFVLLASVNLEKYMQSRSQTLPRQNAVIALVDDKGTVLTWHPAGEKLRGTSIADSPLFRFARERQSKEGRENIEFGGASRIWAASALPEISEAGLHILVGLSKKDLFAAANRNLIQALATLVVVSLLIFAGAWMVVELGVRRPAARIIAAGARFSGGDVGARIGKPYPRGEIGDLMTALDHAFELMQTQQDVTQGAHGESEKSRREAEELARVARVLTESLDAGEVARRIVETVRPLFRAKESVLRFLDPDGSLRVLAASGAMGEFFAPGHVLPPGVGLMGHVAAGGRPLWSADVAFEAGIERTEDYSRRMAATGGRALLAVPLRTKDHLIGVLAIADQAGRAFGEPEVTLLQAFADQAALAIENARLYTESVQQKEHLADQTALLTTTLENIGHGFAVFDRDLRLVAWNNHYLDLLEFPSEFGRVGQSAADFFRHNAERGDYGPGSVEEHVTRRMARARRFKPHHFEWRRRDGTVIDVRGNPLPGGGIVSTYTDVTPLKMANQTMLKLSSAVEQTAETVLICNRAGVIEYVNPAFEAVTGYTREQAIGKTPRLLKSGQHNPAFYRELWDTILSGRVYRGVLVNRKQSGDVYFEDEIITPLTDATGTVTHFVSTGRDITEHTLAERAMHAIAEGTAGAIGEEFFRSLVRHLAQALGVRSAIVGELTGPAKDRVLTRAVWSGGDFVHDFDYPLAGSPCAGLARGEQRVYASGVRAVFPRHELLERMQAEGYLGVPLRASTGEVLGVLVVMDDAPLANVASAQSLLKIFAARAGTELEREQTSAALHEQEMQFRQAQKMEAVGQLAGGIAHDFNNLLTVIIGRSALLLQQMSSDDPARRNIGLIAKTGERAAQLTRQLLAFSRRQVLEMRVLDLNAVVAGMEPLLHRLIGEHITLTLRPDSSLWRTKSDVGQLEQVIMNVAVNARDAMPEGGQLAIETGNVTLDEVYARSHPGAVPGPYVMLAASDTGVGMDAETQSRVFEPFFTTKETGKGTGLGLAMVYGIVKQSDGYVSVDSELGRGTTFRIYLPQVEETVEAGGTTAETDPRPRGSETVLLVEDEEGVRELAHEILETLGYTVLAAGRPDEALKIVAQHPGPIHLLLTDVIMPGMSGPALAGRLLSARRDLKVLYMSGYTDLRHGLLAAGTTLLQKPFTPDALARKVREVLDSAPPL
jgi:PAS domain S-box-containing protein